MAKMKVVQVPKAGADLELVEREIPQPGAGQVRIRAPAPFCLGDTHGRKHRWSCEEREPAWWRREGEQPFLPVHV